MFGPDAGMISHQLTAAVDVHARQVCGDLDAPPDGGWVHRVVVAVHPHVVITRQSGRAAPAHARPDRWQCQHRRLISVDAVGRSTPQHPVLAVISAHQPVEADTQFTTGSVAAQPEANRGYLFIDSALRRQLSMTGVS